MATRDYNRNTRRMEERDSSKDSGYQTGAGAASANTNRSVAGAGLGAAAKSRPRVPQRKDYAGDKEYQTAFQAYMKQQNGDTDTIAQKRALGRMK